MAHALGFRVMLWVVPFVSPDRSMFRELRTRELLLRGSDGEVAIRRWWNGYSAVPDLTNPDAFGWLREVLRRLTIDVGVDGFKFDAGDLRDIRHDDRSHGGGGPVDQTKGYARLGAEFASNEFRASWKSGGQPLAQRLDGKPATWGAGGARISHS